MRFIYILSGVLLCAAFVILRQPDDFFYARQMRINAPASVIFTQVNNLKQWQKWSPWSKLDPEAKETFSGPEAGKDAAMSWEGNADVGVGVMTITESVPDSYVQFRLDFKEPMAATHDAEFTFTDLQNGQTLVTWSMHGTGNLLGKAMGFVFNCEKMLGEQFIQGLGSLKELSESEFAKMPVIEPEMPVVESTPES